MVVLSKIYTRTGSSFGAIIALLAWAILKEPISPGQWAGIGLIFAPRCWRRAGSQRRVFGRATGRRTPTGLRVEQIRVTLNALGGL